MIRRALADRIEDKLGELLARVAAILVENRAEVLALAHALETHRTLTGDDVEAVIEGREGESIDGSAYRDPEFAARLEDYHTAAVGAHRGHSGMPIALPPGRSTVDDQAEGTAAATA
jgi:cell division protease FtsH